MILRIARRLARDRRGNVSEFLLTIPLWIILVFAVLNIGRFFFARAGIQNGLGEAARVATLWPAKTSDDIEAAFTAGAFGLTSSEEPDIDISTGTANGQSYVEIEVEYDPEFFLLFIPVQPVTLSYTRRAYRPT